MSYKSRGCWSVNIEFDKKGRVKHGKLGYVVRNLIRGRHINVSSIRNKRRVK